MQLALNLILVLICKFGLGSHHLLRPLHLLVLLLHDHQVLLVEHLLLPLAYPTQLLLIAHLLFAFLHLLDLPVFGLFHLFSELEIFNEFSLGLSLILHFLLKTGLSSFVFCDLLGSFLGFVVSFLLFPLSQLLLYLLSLLHGHISRPFTRRRARVPLAP